MDLETGGGTDVGERLRGEGYRMTEQRRLVWEALRSGRHLTAEEIHARAPEVDLASVYRTLTLLERLELAAPVQLGDGVRRWELAHTDDEFHLACVRCGRVSHHESDTVAQVREHLEAQHGFVPLEVDLVVHGICQTCSSVEDPHPGPGPGWRAARGGG